MSDNSQFSPMVDDYSGIPCEIVIEMILKYPFLDNTDWICKMCTVKEGLIKDLKLEANGYTKSLQSGPFSQSYEFINNYIKEYFILCCGNVIVPRKILDKPVVGLTLFNQPICVTLNGTNTGIMHVFVKTTLREKNDFSISFQKTWCNLRRGKWGRAIKD